MIDISYKELHRAAEDGDLARVRICLAAGVHPDARDELGRTALMLSKKLVFEIVDLLLKAGADPNARDQNGDTPLHYNSRARDYYKYRRLVDKGADLLAVNNKGISPLEIILEFASFSDIATMTKGARNFTEERTSQVIKDPEHMAQLKIFGLWHTKAEKAYGRRLHEAIRKSNLNAVTNILSERLLVETLNKYGQSPLFEALYCKPGVARDMVKLLLDAGASRKKRGRSSRSPLEEALILARPDIVHLIDPDCHITETVREGITHITIVDNDQFQITLYPNHPGVRLAAGQYYPRGKEGGGEWTAKEILRINRGLLERAGAGWLLPFLEQYAAGGEVRVHELERACRQSSGENLRIHSTAVSYRSI